MKYTKDQRLDIAGRIVNHELTYTKAAKDFDVSLASISNWVREYKALNHIQARKDLKTSQEDYQSLSSLSKEELIDEVIKARIGEARAKKGYMVKGGGQKKEFVSLFNKNIK